MVDYSITTKKFGRRERGAVTAEYAIIIALVAIVTIAALIGLGNRVQFLYVAVSARVAGTDLSTTDLIGGGLGSGDGPDGPPAPPM